MPLISKTIDTAHDFEQDLINRTAFIKRFIFTLVSEDDFITIIENAVENKKFVYIGKYSGAAFSNYLYDTYLNKTDEDEFKNNKKFFIYYLQTKDVNKYERNYIEYYKNNAFILNDKGNNQLEILEGKIYIITQQEFNEDTPKPKNLNNILSFFNREEIINEEIIDTFILNLETKLKENKHLMISARLLSQIRVDMKKYGICKFYFVDSLQLESCVNKLNEFISTNKKSDYLLTKRKIKTQNLKQLSIAIVV